MPTVLNTSYIVKELREAAGDLNPVRDEALTPVDVLLAAAARLEELSERRPVDRTLVDRLESRLQEAVKERDRLLKLVESAYVEGWQDAHTQKATHGPMSVTTPWEVSATRRALTERSNEE